MNKTKTLALLRSIIKENEDNHIYPSHTTLTELISRAAKDFENFDGETFKELLRSMVKKKIIYAGNTVNDIWITHKKNK